MMSIRNIRYLHSMGLSPFINSLHQSRSLSTSSNIPDFNSEKLSSGTNAINNEMLQLFGSLEDHETLDTSHQTTPISRNTTAPAATSYNPNKLTHTDDTGKASMVDVTSKSPTTRSATASARVLLGSHAFSLVAANKLKKGDVLTVAQLAGIMGAKQTSSLIPLCHPLLLSHVDVSLELEERHHAVDITATVTTTGNTGVEMEAMTAVTVSALTVYDMCKAASKRIEISDVRLLRKSGGKSGEWSRSMESIE